MWIEKIEEYVPKNEQERVDQKAMVAFAKRNDDALSRDNLVAHFTSSAIVVGLDKNHLIQIFFLRIY